MRALLAFAAAALLGLAQLRDAGCSAPATYVNPVIDADFPDPAVLKAPDGYYYAYATQTQRDGKWINIQLARSADLVHWQYLGDALPAKPRWAATTQDFWAPDVVKRWRALRHVLFGQVGHVGRAPRPVPWRRDRKLARSGRSSIWAIRFSAARASSTSTRWRSTIPRPASTCFTGARASSRSRSRELAPDRLSFAPGSAPKDLVAPNPVKDAFPVLIEGTGWSATAAIITSSIRATIAAGPRRIMR